MRNLKMIVAIGVIIVLMTTACQPPDTGGGGVTTIPVHVVAIVINTGGTATVVIEMTDDGSPVTGATILVNGNTIPYYAGAYYMATIGTIATGANVPLAITGTGINISASVTMPTAPVITAPAAGSYPAANPLPVAWNAVAPIPSEIQVTVDMAYTSSGPYSSGMLAGTATNHTIPGGTLATGQGNIPINVVTTNRLLLNGTSYEVDSSFSAANASSVNISTP